MVLYKGVIIEFRGFTKEALEFLSLIRHNNTKEWFESHREDYERLILEPCRLFVMDMGEHLQALVPTINAVPKINGSLFKIYRDIRFSKDKTPIKSKIGVIFWQGGGKRMQSASFYLHFCPDFLFFAVGIRGFSKETQAGYREYIKDDAKREELHNILTGLSKKGYEIPKPKYKRLPNGFDKSMKYSYLSLYDCMYAFLQIAHPKSFFTDRFCDEAYKIYEDMYDLHQWVYSMTLTIPQELF